jgi:hypothetical protein
LIFVYEVFNLQLDTFWVNARFHTPGFNPIIIC